MKDIDQSATSKRNIWMGHSIDNYPGEDEVLRTDLGISTSFSDAFMDSFHSDGMHNLFSPSSDCEAWSSHGYRGPH